jgi:flagellar hook-associated protein 3 FlgL
MEDLLLEVEDVGRQASSELLTQQQRDAMAAQVDEYLKELVDLSNSTSRGKYIFGGTETGTSPFIPDATENMTQVTQNPKGISQDLIREVGRSQRVAINVSGADILQPDGSYESGANPAGKDTDAFNVLIELRDALRAGDTDAVSAQVEKLDAVYDRVLERDSMLGATISRVQFSQQRGEDEVLDKTERLSNVEDTDYPKAITDYYAKQNMYNTALQIGAQLIQMSIVNFI